MWKGRCAVLLVSELVTKAVKYGGDGHGLRLVDAIADRWGVEDGSTIVCFEFDVANG